MRLSIRSDLWISTGATRCVHRDQYADQVRVNGRVFGGTLVTT